LLLWRLRCRCKGLWPLSPWTILGSSCIPERKISSQEIFVYQFVLLPIFFSVEYYFVNCTKLCLEQCPNILQFCSI
jgi:hypothetical protein